MNNNIGNLNFGTGSAFARLTVADIQRNSSIVSATPAATVGDAYTPSNQAEQPKKGSLFPKLVGLAALVGAGVFIKNKFFNNVQKFAEDAAKEAEPKLRAHIGDLNKNLVTVKTRLTDVFSNALENHKKADDITEEAKSFLEKHAKDSNERTKPIAEFVDAMMEGKKITVNGKGVDVKKFNLTEEGTFNELMHYTTSDKLQAEIADAAKAAQKDGKKLEDEKSTIIENLFKTGKKDKPSIADKAIDEKIMFFPDVQNSFNSFVKALTTTAEKAAE